MVVEGPNPNMLPPEFHCFSLGGECQSTSAPSSSIIPPEVSMSKVPKFSVLSRRRDSSSSLRCEKQFGTRVQLKHHMNIHLGLKPYSCKECGKAFTQPTHLSVHRRIHNGVKPYMCSICGKTFAIASNMRKHAAIHERDGTDHQIPFEAEPAVVPQFEPVAVQPFSCNHCEMRFSALKKLAMHERREHGSQHLCPQPGCQRACMSSSSIA